MFETQLKDKSIALSFHCNPKITLNSDIALFKRIITNLISNAIKFSNSNTTVSVVVTVHNESEVKVSINDEGPGISQEDQKKLFNKFQKLSARPTGSELSTGLGLYIVKNLIEKLNGSVLVKSELGKGTQFVILFKGYAQYTLGIDCDSDVQLLAP